MNKSKSVLEDDAMEQFELRDFFPYQVRVFYTEVTSAVAQIYQEQHDMSAAEWRCLAILNGGEEMTAADIVIASSMDKVTVSRALSKLGTRDWVTLTHNRQDGRSKLIQLSTSGKAILRDLMPKILEVEARLLDGLSENQIRQFQETLAKISVNRAMLS